MLLAVPSAEGAHPDQWQHQVDPLTVGANQAGQRPHAQGEQPEGDHVSVIDSAISRSEGEIGRLSNSG
jgi:hypothetical protein